MKTEYKIDGTKLKLAVEESLKYDADKDAVASAEAALKLEVTIDGLELMDELLKSNDLVKKAHDKLIELGVIKA